MFFLTLVGYSVVENVVLSLPLVKKGVLEKASA